MIVRKVMNKEEVDVDYLIDKGARAKEDRKEPKEWIMINLRISSGMLKAVDGAVERRVGITRTGWVLEAIHEKLEK